MSKKISELDQVNDLYQGCCFPLVQNEETKKVTYETLKNKIIEDSDNYFENKIDTKIVNKVDKVTGKGLTTNDFTDEYKNKLENKADLVMLHTDWEHIYRDKDCTQLLTFADIKELTNDNTKLVTLYNGNYVLRPEYTYEKDGVEAIWFNGVTSLNGKPYIYRVIINSNEQLSSDEYELAQTNEIPKKTSDLTNDSGFVTDVTAKEDKVNKTTTITSESTDTQYPSAKAVYQELAELKAKNENLYNGLDRVKAVSVDEEVHINNAKPMKTLGVEIQGKTVQGENPTPDNPQEIENLSYKNYYNGKSALKYCGSTGTIAENTNGNYLGFNDLQHVEPNTTYHVEFVESVTTNKTFNVAEYDINRNFIQRVSTPNVRYFTTTENTHYIFCYLYTSDGSFINESNKNIMLEKGEIYTSYVPYGNIAINTRGNNIFNYQNVVHGYIDVNNKIVSNSLQYASNYMIINSDTLYITTKTIVKNIGYIIYDGDNKILSRVNTNNTAKVTINSSNASYIRIWINKNDTEMSIEDLKNLEVQVSCSDTTYEPYAENHVYIDLDGNELAKVGTVADKLLIDKKGNVAIEKNIGKVVLNGSENWSKNGDSPDGNFISFYIYGAWARNQIALSDYFIGKLWDITTSKNEDSCWSSTTSCGFRINKENLNGYNSSMTNTEKIQLFKNWLSAHNTTVQYVLATPQIINLPKITPLTTLKGKNYITIESNVGSTDFDIEYVEDLKYYIENLANRLSLLED